MRWVLGAWSLELGAGSVTCLVVFGEVSAEHGAQAMRWAGESASKLILKGDCEKIGSALHRQLTWPYVAHEPQLIAHA